MRHDLYYLCNEQTGMRVETYTEEDVNTLAGGLFQQVYLQYPDVVENIYS